MDDHARRVRRPAHMPVPSKRLWHRMAIAAFETLQLHGLAGEGELQDQPDEVREALLASMRSAYATVALLDRGAWERLEAPRE